MVTITLSLLFNHHTGHAADEAQAKRSHELWLACETFKRTISTGKTGVGIVSINN